MWRILPQEQELKRQFRKWWNPKRWKTGVGTSNVTRVINGSTNRFQNRGCDCSIRGYDMIARLREPNYMRNYLSIFSTRVKMSFWLTLTILCKLTYLTWVVGLYVESRSAWALVFQGGCIIEHRCSVRTDVLTRCCLECTLIYICYQTHYGWIMA